MFLFFFYDKFLSDTENIVPEVEDILKGRFIGDVDHVDLISYKQ